MFKKSALLFLLLPLLFVSACSSTEDVSAVDRSTEVTAEQLVDKSRSTVETIANDKDFAGVKELLPRAKGVLIFPQLVRAGFIVGGEGGRGVVLKRNPDGSWSYPAFYNTVGGCLGLQIGVESAEALFLIMTDKAMNAVVRNQFRLGADVSVALGPVGAGLGAGKSSLDLAADMYVYSKNTGLFTGGALKGTIITVRDDLNKAYYGRLSAPKDILNSNEYMNMQAEGLRAALSLQQSSNPKAVPLTPVEQY